MPESSSKKSFTIPSQAIEQISTGIESFVIDKESTEAELEVLMQKLQKNEKARIALLAKIQKVEERLTPNLENLVDTIEIQSRINSLKSRRGIQIVEIPTQVKKTTSIEINDLPRLKNSYKQTLNQINIREITNKSSSSNPINIADTLKEYPNLTPADLANISYGMFLDLRGVDLSNVDLQEVELNSANLCGVNLSGAMFKLEKIRYAKVDSGTYLEDGFVTLERCKTGDLAKYEFNTLSLKQTQNLR